MNSEFLDEMACYQVIVVGAGHAGCEAALAAARMGCLTLLITLTPESAGLTPCNPAMGGPAKSVVVREIDALGGVMGRLTDQACLQARMLNTSKGPAVQALRMQIDKALYQRLMLAELRRAPRLDIRQGEVIAALLDERGAVRGCRISNGAEFFAPCLVLACGTYLNGRVLIGDFETASGPLGHNPALALSGQLQALGLKKARFKTGTPARLDAASIDFSLTRRQDGEQGLAFSFLTRPGQFDRPSLPSWLTATTAETHRVIRDNLSLSPLYSGRIEGVGPRYCPSIEDKVVRFPGRESHQLFLEPETADLSEYYVQGMSSSLPEQVQTAFLRTIPALERCRLVRPAYAIEYDCFDPRDLKATLETKTIPGLFRAGQINGTSGYEEAGGQGLLAGVNAALRALGQPAFTLRRDQGYIGLLADDLITKGTQEPYRLFTSRSEYRLLLRQDNADLRLTPMGMAIPGLISQERSRAFHVKQEALAAEMERLEKTRPSAKQLSALDGEAKGQPSLAQLLGRPDIDPDLLYDLCPPGEPVDAAVREQAIIQLKYRGYLDKQQRQVERFRQLEDRSLPADMDYLSIAALSHEAAEKLDRFRPASIGQAARISGVSPADINVLLALGRSKSSR